MAKLDPKLEQYFTELEGEYNLPSNFLKSVARAESAFNPKAVSPVGAKGMFQFMPATAKEWKVNVEDPFDSAKGAAKYYSWLLKRHNNDINEAMAAYNWGTGNVGKKGMSKLPKETRDYVSKINSFMNNYNSEKKK